MDIRDVTKLFDLEYYDGPLLSLFADANGNFYLYKWYDVVPDSHQWLVWHVPYETLLRYLNGMANEFDLLDEKPNDPFYLVQFSKKGQPVVVGRIAHDRVLEAYTELKTVYFDPQLCPNWRAVRHFFQAPLEPATA